MSVFLTMCCTILSRIYSFFLLWIQSPSSSFGLCCRENSKFLKTLTILWSKCACVTLLIDTAFGIPFSSAITVASYTHTMSNCHVVCKWSLFRASVLASQEVVLLKSLIKNCLQKVASRFIGRSISWLVSVDLYWIGLWLTHMGVCVLSYHKHVDS